MIVLSDHAREQATRRGLSEDIVLAVARKPEQRLDVRSTREIRQSRVELPPEGIVYLVRVVVDVAPTAETVVTVYRTSKVDKYWSKA